MRKKIILFFALFFLGMVCSVFSQLKIISESDAELKKLFEFYKEKGIQSISTIRYDVEDGKITEDKEKISQITIDATKNSYTEITYYPNYSKSVTTFNEGLNVKDISIYYSDNNLMSRVITNYESDNSIKNKIYYLGNSITFITNYFYSSGNVIKIEYVDSTEKIINSSKLFYDSSDRLIEEDKYNEFDSLEIVYQYSYDKMDNCVEEIISYPQVNHTSKTLYKYDKNGNKTEKIVYSSGDKLIMRNEYIYNDKGLLIKEIVYSIDNKITSENNYNYDEKGLKTEWRYKDYIEEFEYLYKYEYSF